MQKISIIYGLEAVGGGALKHLAYLVTYLDKERFDITVILSSKRNEDANVEIKKIENSGARLLYYPLNRNFNILKDLISVLKLIPILKKEQFDIIHAHSSKAGGIFRVAAFFAGNKNVLYTPHCFYFQGLSGIRRKVYVSIEKILAKITSNIIVSEGELKETVKNRIINENQIQNINNAIDFDDYIHNSQIDETLSEFCIPEGKFIVGAIGRLSPQKGWETFIFAA
jgi:glycosyltransferase involved in cell wall biosynthesis